MDSASSGKVASEANAERSTYCAAAMLYKLVSNTWEIMGGGVWAEMHLYFRLKDDDRCPAFRLVARVPQTLDVLLDVELSRASQIILSEEHFYELSEPSCHESYGMYFAEDGEGMVSAIESAVAEVSRRRQSSLSNIAAVESKLIERLEESPVTSVSHDTHVVFNAAEARFEGLPEAWKQSGATRQFGVELSSLPKVDVAGYDHKIPAVLVMLARKLNELDGLKTLGIFRIAPDQQVCKDAKRAIDRGDKWDDDPELDAHAVANLIKVFFRELPPIGLLNWLGDLTIGQLAKQPPHTAERVVQGLQEPHKSVLLWLLDLMVLIVKHEQFNRMSAKNVSIVFSPNMYSTHNDNPMAAITMAQTVAECTTTLLLWRLNHHSGKC